MRIIIEEYKYSAADVKDVLRGIDALENIEGYVSVNYVGYFYNSDEKVRDCVFILPKVLLEDKDGKELVFGKYRPEEIINLDKNNPLTQGEKDFIYEFAVWIYRAIVVFHNDKRNKTSIVYHKKIAEVGNSSKRLSNTFLDILLSLIQFNKENQDFFFFILRNIHSGFNKINWTRTIATTDAIIQGKDVIYLHPVNKKRQINFDEELLVIFFSILNYISEHYGFPVQINCNFQLITGNQFQAYLNGMGKVRLRQIKYKYFSDKALQLWELCFAFFDSARQVYVCSEQKEYLLVKNFNIVFEAIIDELIGDRDIPSGLKEQEDGKRVDHMYSYQGLTTNDDDKPIYYIGDSKYYKRGNEIDKKSVYKQFTYARNVIQWNLNLFMNDDNDEELQYDKQNFGNVPKLRDDVTEGYNVIPNFFISAKLNEELSYKDDIEITDKQNTHFSNKHFQNRLFDRDTLLICHYDVNFLYVVSLYARNNRLQKDAWKKKVRKLIRAEIQKMLGEQYQFYVMTPKAGVNASVYIEKHFQQLLGKVFTPYENIGTPRYYSLALNSDEKFEVENSAIVSQLETAFHVCKCKIDDDPRVKLAGIPQEAPAPIPTTPNFLTLHYLEKYQDKSILVGYYKDAKHLQWILGANDRGTLLYNVRLGKNVHGGFIKNQLDKMVVSFVILYEYGHADDNKYRVFRVHHHATMTAERLKRSLYPSEPTAEKYLCYVFDEEVSLGNIDIAKLISKITDEDKEKPVFKTGAELMKYKT